MRSAATTTASSGVMPGTNRRSSTLASFHETGCTAAYVTPGRCSEKGNCCRTANICGSIAGPEKSGNHRLRYKGSAIKQGEGTSASLHYCKRGYAGLPAHSTSLLNGGVLPRGYSIIRI